MGGFDCSIFGLIRFDCSIFGLSRFWLFSVRIEQVFPLFFLCFSFVFPFVSSSCHIIHSDT